MDEIHNFLREEGIQAQIFDRWVKPPYMKERTLMTNISVKAQGSLVVMMEAMIPHLLMKQVTARQCLTFARSRLDRRGIGSVAPNKQKTNVYWQREEISRLLELHNEGHGNLSIAAKLGRSRESVTHKLMRLGVRRPKQCHADVLAMVAEEGP